VKIYAQKKGVVSPRKLLKKGKAFGTFVKNFKPKGKGMVNRKGLKG